LYDIRPGNGAGLFFQPCSPQGATETKYIAKKIKSITVYLDMVYKAGKMKLTKQVNEANTG